MPGAPTPDRDSHRRLQAVERELAALRRQLEQSKREAILVQRPNERLARAWTLNAASYPTDPDTTVFPIVFIDATFTSTVGEQSLSTTDHSLSEQTAAYSLCGAPKRGDLLVVREIGRRQYIVEILCLTGPCCFTFGIDPKSIPGYDESASYGQVLMHLGGCWLWKSWTLCPEDEPDEEGGECGGESQYYWNGAEWELMSETCSDGCLPQPPDDDGDQEGEIQPGTCVEGGAGAAAQPPAGGGEAAQIAAAAFVGNAASVAAQTSTGSTIVLGAV